jgi:hypothetical protein
VQIGTKGNASHIKEQVFKEKAPICLRCLRGVVGRVRRKSTSSIIEDGRVLGLEMSRRRRNEVAESNDQPTSSKEILSSHKFDVEDRGF